MKTSARSASVQSQSVKSAQAAGLRYVTDEIPGIKRVKTGADFRYIDSRGKPVRDRNTLNRVRSLAVPPAWRDVWICPLENGHLQATGRDDRGRKQHCYHPLWREVRDATKYERLVDFGKVLPKIRRRVARDLTRPGLTREKVLATIIRLMDVAFMRVGNEEYARQNKSYGLTTMKDQHAEIRGERIRFAFRGKSGKEHSIEVADRRLAKIVKHCQDIPGQELFQYYENDGERRDVTSGDVNDYLRELSGADFTAKDFRTWAGTVLAAQALAGGEQPETQGQAKKKIKEAIAAVAEKLGNTPTVCRKCYIHPAILNGCIDHTFGWNGTANSRKLPMTQLSNEEKCVLNFLRCRREEHRAASILPAKSHKNASGTLAARSTAAIPAAWRPRLSGRKVRRR